MALVTQTVRCPFERSAGTPCEAEFEIKGHLTHGWPEELWQHVCKDHPLPCSRARQYKGVYLRGLEGSGVDNVTDEQIKLHLGECQPCQHEFFGLGGAKGEGGGGSPLAPSGLIRG